MDMLGGGSRIPRVRTGDLTMPTGSPRVEDRGANEYTCAAEGCARPIFDFCPEHCEDPEATLPLTAQEVAAASVRDLADYQESKKARWLMIPIEMARDLVGPAPTPAPERVEPDPPAPNHVLGGGPAGHPKGCDRCTSCARAGYPANPLDQFGHALPEPSADPKIRQAVDEERERLGLEPLSKPVPKPRLHSRPGRLDPLRALLGKLHLEVGGVRLDELVAEAVQDPGVPPQEEWCVSRAGMASRNFARALDLERERRGIDPRRLERPPPTRSARGRAERTPPQYQEPPDDAPR